MYNVSVRQWELSELSRTSKTDDFPRRDRERFRGPREALAGQSRLRAIAMEEHGERVMEQFQRENQFPVTVS